MPFDGSGNASVTRNIAVTGQTVFAEQVNTPFADIQSMLGQVVLRSGVAPMTGALNMNGFRVNGAADGVSPADLATVGQVQSAAPIGSVVSFAGNSAPSGWVLCFGQELSRTEYASLFAVIGTSFGSGNGSSTFNVPDCRGRIEVGKDDMGGTDSTRMNFFGSLAKTIGAAFGTASHILTVGQLPAHSHGITDPGHAHGGVQNSPAAQGRGDQLPAVAQANLGASDVSGTGITIQNTGSGESHTNTQPSIVFNKIIKVS